MLPQRTYAVLSAAVQRNIGTPFQKIRAEDIRFAELLLIAVTEGQPHTVFVQRPGEVVVVPPGCWHAVFNLSETVALAINFVFNSPAAKATGHDAKEANTNISANANAVPSPKSDADPISNADPKTDSTDTFWSRPSASFAAFWKTVRPKDITQNQPETPKGIIDLM